MSSLPGPRLVVAFGVVSLLPLLLMAYFSVHLATSAVRKEAEDGISNTASVSALFVGEEMDGLAELVDSYADRPYLIDAIKRDDREAIVTQLEELVHRDDIRTAFLADPSGRLIDVRPATPEIVGDDFSFRDWYQGVTTTGEPYVSEAYQSAARGEPRIVAAAAPVEGPAEDGSGEKVVGIVAAAYDLDAIQDYAIDFARSQGVTLTITDQRGTVVAGPGGDPSALLSHRSDPRVEAALEGRSGVVEVDGPTGRELEAYGPVPSLGWTVRVTLPLKEALSGVSTLRSTVSIISAVLALMVVGVLIVLMIALRQRANTEKELKESEGRVRAIIGAATEAFVSMNDRGDITDWNDKASSTFGWDREEVIGRTVADVLVPPELRQSHKRGIKHFLETGEGPLLGRRTEIEALHRDGRRFPAELVVWSVKSGDEWSFNAFVADITERKKIEQELALAHEHALEASRHKSEFLANMSHEIRTPMNAVIGMTGLLLTTQLTPEQYEYADTVRSSGEALLTLINDILDFSKIEAGRMDIEEIDFDLRTVVEEVGDLLADQAHEKGLELAILVKSAVPVVVRGDPGRIRQVLVNLVGNAIKFTPEGEVVVRVDASEERNQDLIVRFEVTDTGIGLSPEQQERIFSSFTQADASSTRQYGGTGLGLAISKQLTELMDGEIGVQSRSGVGSTFWFTARLKRGSQRYASPSKRRSLRGLRALVVDDNATNRTILIESLKSWGMKPASASGGPEAIELLREAADNDQPFEVALLDFHMPAMDGLELARTIRDDNPINDTRLVLLTSAGKRGDARKAREAGIEVYLTKPVRLSALYDCLATLSGVDGDGASGEVITQRTLADIKAQSRVHILVAEDNPVNQKVAVRMLEMLGHRVDVVSNGVEAVEAVARNPYAAVLMDCQMPEMDGFEATMKIRRLESAHGAVPIVAMTAGAMSGDREKCLAAGMNDYVSKPVTIEDLATVLDRRIESSGAEESGTELHEARRVALNKSRLSSLIAYETERGELVREFMADAGDKLRVFEQSVEQGDLSGAHDAAHTLKSAVATLGAEDYARMCDNAQQAALNGSADELNRLVQAMQTEFVAMVAALRIELPFLDE